MISTHASYLEGLFMDYHKTLKTLKNQLKGKRYDTLVATGLSGALIILPLAKMLRKNALVVRKPKEDSHSYHMIEGTLGKRWIFVDDQIATGDTLERVQKAIAQYVKDAKKSAKKFPWLHDDLPADFAPKFVGAALYLDGFQEPDEAELAL